ncbi:Putative transposon Ty5-1 protein YCL075W, partial [Camponotus floridanus]
KDNAWCIDSGCTSHLCRDEEKFEEISNTENTRLNLANHGSTDIKAKGTVKVTATDGNTTRAVYLENTLHVPDLRNNLISVAKITDAGNRIIFTKEGAEIKNKRGTTVLVADRKGDLYFLRESRKESTYAASTKANKSPMAVWHERFGHLNWNDI